MDRPGVTKETAHGCSRCHVPKNHAAVFGAGQNGVAVWVVCHAPDGPAMPITGLTEMPHDFPTAQVPENERAVSGTGKRQGAIRAKNDALDYICVPFAAIGSIDLPELP